MKNPNTLKRCVMVFAAVLTCFLTSSTFAEQKKTFGKYDMHYVASNTAMLTPQIAKIYKIQRSKSKGIVTIAVRDTDSDKASEALIRGSVKNALGQMQSLDFAIAKDQSAIYYLAVFNFADLDIMKFSILVTPDGSSDTHVIEFDQQFFVE